LWLERVGRDYDNLRAALRWLRESGDAGGALRLARALWLYSVMRGDLTEVKHQIEAVLALPGVTDDPATLAPVLLGAGQLARLRGELAAARSYFESLLAYYQGSHDCEGIGVTLTWLGEVAREQGDLTRALPWLEEALVLLRGAGNPQALGFALLYLGNACRDHGDLVRARSLLEESVAVYRGGGLTELLATQALDFLGVVVEELGDGARARSIYREALIHMGRIEDRGHVTNLLESLASLATKANQPARALRLIGAANRLREQIGNPHGLVFQRRQARTLELARRQLAPDAADADLAAGRTMTLQEAVAYALEDDGR
jgi:non-specific serine/threonine protein kinase